MRKILVAFYLLLSGLMMFISTVGQNRNDSLFINKDRMDSLYISEIENVKGLRPKVLHAEPLFIDLIRDLGARKGEKEWNIGFGMSDNRINDSYVALIEYEFAVIDRLGFEIELPFTFFSRSGGSNLPSNPGNKLNSLKLAGQYTVLVNDKQNMSCALGYIHEFELNDFNKYKTGRVYKGNIYNPFAIFAKRWTDNLHLLFYGGPIFESDRIQKQYHSKVQMNASFHYMIRGTRNFLGIEINKNVEKGANQVILRPQMRIGLAENLMVGIVSGMPLRRNNLGMSNFIRLIYEPGHLSFFSFKRPLHTAM